MASGAVVPASVVDPDESPVVPPVVVDPIVPVVVSPVDPVVSAAIVVPVEVDVGPVVGTLDVCPVVVPVTVVVVPVAVLVVPPELDEPVMSAPGEKQPPTRQVPTSASLATPRAKGIPDFGVIDRIAATIPQRPRAALWTAFGAVLPRAPAAEEPRPAPGPTPFPCAETGSLV